jgi:hypothetical protein
VTIHIKHAPKDSVVVQRVFKDFLTRSKDVKMVDVIVEEGNMEITDEIVGYKRNEYGNITRFKRIINMQ